MNQSVLGYLNQRRRARDAEAQMEEDDQPKPKKQKFTFPNPLETLAIIADKESAIILLYNGLFFSGLMMVTSAIPYMYEKTYGLDELKIGLCYIAMGCGSLTSALTTGHIMDWNFRRHAQRLGIVLRKGKQSDLSKFPIEVARIQVIMPGHIIAVFALITFGWTIKYHTHIAGPEIALYFIGFGISCSFNNTNTLLLDLHRNQAATATSAINFCR